MFEKEHVLQVLKQVKSAVEKENVIALKELSNQTIHTASIEQDPNAIAIAVIIYSLSKIIERKKYTYYKEWPSFYKIYTVNIDRAIKALQEDNIEKFRENIDEIRREIGKLSGKFKKYIQDVFRAYPQRADFQTIIPQAK